jgi:hypothetical protein
MHAHTEVLDDIGRYPVRVTVPAALDERDRLTTAFRFFLGIPHLLIVGGPVGMVTSLGWSNDDHFRFGSSSGGVLGAVATVAAIISWFAILLTGRHPHGLRELCAFYLRWRVRAVAYMTLLRDEYPPFGDGSYPADLELDQPPEEARDRLTVAIRLILVLPHLIVVGLLGMVWGLTTALAWIAILLTGRYPKTLYGFAIGVLSWSTRVEAYALLLTDEYPPFSLRA